MSNAPIAHAGFFLSLIAFQIQFYRYWVSGTLGTVLVNSAVLGLLAFLTGRSALGEVMRRRSGKTKLVSGKH
jgi:oligosaccharyltransferase complex subunit delta (ribophorin II)